MKNAPPIPPQHHAVISAPLPAEAVPAALPGKLSPQLATLANVPPMDVEDWIYEVKFDGYRILVRIHNSGVRLFTRHGHNWTSKLSTLQQELVRLQLPSGWYDGEVVLPNREGIPDFAALQRAFETVNTSTVVLYLFDLPYVEGHDLRAAPLEERRAVLKRLLSRVPSRQVRFSEAFEAPRLSVLGCACELGLEGVVAKHRRSCYRSSRSVDWLKLKCSQRQEFVVGGYTDPQGARLGFGALLLGVHDDAGVLQYVGKVGTGFSQQILHELKAALESRVCATNPFGSPMGADEHRHWVTPTLVAEVSFGEWTRSGHIRHAIFQGLRSDKEASTIVREKTNHPGMDEP